MEFGLAGFVVADGFHRFWVGEDFHGFEERFEAFRREEVADDFVAAGDEDRVLGGLADHRGELGLGLGDGIRRCHNLLRSIFGGGYQVFQRCYGCRRPVP
jgi:hypothetical protein